MAAKVTSSKHLARQLKVGQNPIAGFGAAARRKVAATRNGPKATETDHLRPDQFAGGRHRAPSNSYSVGKNVSTPMNSRNTGRHAPYEGKHRGGEDHWKDVSAVIQRGGGPAFGRHAKPSNFRV